MGDMLPQFLADERRRTLTTGTGLMPPDPRIAGAFTGRQPGGRPPPAASPRSSAPAGSLTADQLLAEARRLADAGRTEEALSLARAGTELRRREALRRVATELDRRPSAAAGPPSPVAGVPRGAAASDPDPLAASRAQATARAEALRRAVEAHDREQGTGQPAGASPALRGNGDLLDLLARIDALAAPRGSTAPGGAPIQAQLPNGTIVEFPAGTAEGVMNSAIDRLLVEREAQEPGWSGLTPQQLAGVRARVGGQSIPGSAVPPGVDANAQGGPPPNADALSALLTREGQAARRATAEPTAGTEDTAQLLALAQRRRADALAAMGGEGLRAEIAGNSVRQPGLLERAGLTPSQMGTALQENLDGFFWDGDGDPSTIANRGELLAAALNNAGEAMTFGLVGDEADAAVQGAFAAAVPGGAGYFDAYGPALADNRAQEAALWAQHPGVGLASEVGGGLLGPGAPARFINRGVGLLSRMGRGMAVGAGSGAVYGAMDGVPGATGEDTIGERVMGGLLGGAMGGVAGGAIAGIGQGFIRAAQALKGSPGAEEAVATVEGLRDGAQRLYRAAEESGAVVDPGPLQSLATNVRLTLQREGYNPRLHPRIDVVLEEIDDMATGTQALQRVEQLRRIAGNAAQSMQPDERRLASIVIDRIDDLVDGMDGSEPLRAAREVWGRMRRLERVEQIFATAGDAGGRFETALASGFRSFLRNPRNLRGFSEAERNLMHQIARGSAGVRALRGLADLLAPNSLTGAGAAVGTFMTAGGPAAVLPPLASYGARAVANGMVRSQGNALSRMVGQTEAQRVVVDGLLRQPNALAPFATAPMPQGLLGYFGAQ